MGAETKGGMGGWLNAEISGWIDGGVWELLD